MKEPVRILLGGSSCFTEGHLVLTDLGYKDISKITVGDKVLTHTGHYRKVIRINRRVAPTYRVSIDGYPQFITTANHPFYTLSKSCNYTEWTEVKDLTRKHFCGQHILHDASFESTNDGRYYERFGVKYLHDIPLSPFIYSLPWHHKKAFIEGYLSNKGYRTFGRVKLNTDNLEVACGLQRLAVAVYHRPVSITKRRNSYHLSMPRKATRCRVFDGILWTRVKMVKRTKNLELVYNIEVEHDNSYTVNNCIVHNCTYWSVAQHNNRETSAEGMGWELFRNYLIAKEKFKPDFFLYENNQSASPMIKDQISKELGYPIININSAIFSAQQRKRIYCINKDAKINLPSDKGILLKDILEHGSVETEKAYCLCTDHMGTTRDYFKKRESQIVFEPISMAQRGRYNETGQVEQHYEARDDGKSNCVTTVHKDCLVAEPVRVGDIGTNAQANRVYGCWGKSVAMVANGGGTGAKTGLYFTPVPEELKGLVCDKGKIYHIVDGFIETNVGCYRCNMPDGYYMIRKLTVKEAERLQTLPDGYVSSVEGVSNTQKYKAIGNGWTADVIIFLLDQLLHDLDRETPLEVLSMYDGIATGMYCLSAMGFKNITYRAYEIDDNAIKIAKTNYPNIIECGDAFKVREEGWTYEG